VQTLCLTRRHIVEVKVHAQFSAHHAPRPSKVDHCHWYLPVRYKMASKRPGWLLHGKSPKPEDRLGIYVSVVARWGEVGKRLQMGTLWAFSTFNPTIEDFSIENSKTVLRICIPYL
jgi:hypothetical protein